MYMSTENVRIPITKSLKWNVTKVLRENEMHLLGFVLIIAIFFMIPLAAVVMKKNYLLLKHFLKLKIVG